MAGWFLKPVTLWDGCYERPVIESLTIANITSSSTSTFKATSTGQGAIWQINAKMDET